MDMNRLIAKYIGYPLQDIVKGTSIIKELEFLKRSQFWSTKEIYDYQLLKLKKLIDYSKANVPYYTDLFVKLNISSSDINSLNDLNKIPILTKEILREEGPRLISRKKHKFKVKSGKTGGTTGVPVKVLKDENNRSFTWASYYRWYEWMGLKYYDSVVTIWGARTVLSNSFKSKILLKTQQFIQNESVLNSFEMDSFHMKGFVRIIHKRKPLLLKGYLSAIIQFAAFIEENNIHFDSLKAISTTTETLLPHNREYIEKVFRVPVYDQYGCGEVSAISYECGMHNGLHINQEHVICEVLDNYDKPIINTSGRVIATDLDNYVMPFIRFENGDLATLTDKKCSCGVNQPLMKSIEGRSIDTIILKDGRRVHGVFFTDILYELNVLAGDIHRFQIYQNRIGEIEFRLESKKRIDSSIKKQIEKSLLLFLNRVDIIEMESLPLSKSGKFSYIVNDLYI